MFYWYHNGGKNLKKLLSIFLFFLICNAISAQNISWEMAVLRWTGSEEQSFSPQRPISMNSGDIYYLYIKSDSPGYCYVIQENPDRTSSFVFSGAITGGSEELLPENEDFIVPAGTGIIRFHVVVSSSPRTSLERFANQGSRFTGAQHSALINEIQAIGRSLSTLAEAPELPVRMGGGTRGNNLSVFQYKGQDTYVKTVVIRY